CHQSYPETCPTQRRVSGAHAGSRTPYRRKVRAEDYTRRIVGGRLFGIGLMDHDEAKRVAAQPAERAANWGVHGRDRTRARMISATDSARPTQSATTTRLASVSLPSPSV